MSVARIYSVEKKSVWPGRALGVFALAAAGAVVWWQGRQWIDDLSRIDHEPVQLSAATRGAVAEQFNPLYTWGVQEGAGATLGVHPETTTSATASTKNSFADALEKTTKLANVADEFRNRREREAKTILESYNQFLQTQPLLNQKYEFLKDAMIGTTGSTHLEDESLEENTTALFKVFRQAARDAYTELRLQALSNPDFDYYYFMARASIDSYNTADDPDAEKYRKMHNLDVKEIEERRKHFKPAP